MAALPENGRDINRVDEKIFTGGGSKFANKDTLFARITPCLENGKTSLVSGLSDGEVAFGSTEFIVLAAKEPEYDSDYIYYLSRLGNSVHLLDPEWKELLDVNALHGNH